VRAEAKLVLAGTALAVVLGAAPIPGRGEAGAGRQSATAAAKDMAREKAAAAQKRFQQDMYDMMASRWHHLEGLTAMQRDLQLALIEAQTLRFYFLLQHHPEKIVRDQGISDFLNFDWSDEDDEHLRDDNSEYGELQKRIHKLRGRSDGHAQWPEAREKALSLQAEADFQQAMERLKQAFEEVEELLDASPDGARQ